MNLSTKQRWSYRDAENETYGYQGVIRKGVRQDCILSPCLFNLYAEYIMRNASLDKSQAGMKTVGRIIKNFRYADDTTLMGKVIGN